MNQILQLKQMQVLVTARYDLAQQAFRTIVAEENKLRSELARLKEMEQSMRVEAYENLSMRSIGADIIWQSWVGRTKRQLNMSLSSVLAKKAPHMAAVRRAYGKVLALDELLRDMEKKHARLSRVKELDEVIRQAGQ